MYATTQHLAFRVDLVAAPAYKSYGLKNLLRKVNTTARLLKRDVSHTEAGIWSGARSEHDTRHSRSQAAVEFPGIALSYVKSSAPTAQAAWWAGFDSKG